MAATLSQFSLLAEFLGLSTQSSTIFAPSLTVSHHLLELKVFFSQFHVLSSFLDLQMVNISLRVLSRPQASSLPYIYKNLGTDYDERVLPSIVNEVFALFS